MTYHAMCAHVVSGAACSPRERSARRAARDVSTRLVLPFVLLQMVVSLVFPCGAFALSPNDQGVIWGPERVGIDTSGILVCATNEFDAALWAIDRWSTKIQLDNPKFAMLSNEGTGGHFYELASYFHSYAEVGSPSWPNAAMVEGWAIALGSDNVWLASVPSGLIADARNDYNTVLNGGSLGGGSGSEPGDVLSFSGGVHYTNVSSRRGFSVGSSVAFYTGPTSMWNDDTISKLSSPLTIDVPTNLVSSFVAAHPASDFDYLIRVVGNSSGGFASFLLFAAPVYNNQLTTATNTLYDVGSSYLNSLTWTGQGFYITLTNVRFSSSGNGHLVVSSVSGDGAGTLDSDGNWGSGGGYIYLSGSAHAGPPTLPPNNWPEDDPTPTPDPPEVPGPSDDPIVVPDPPDLPDPREYPVSDPYTPDPDPPTNPVVTYDPNPTGEPTDYRPWLNAILVLLRKINTTISDGFGDLRGWLTNHCDHIREQIHSDSVDLGLHMQASIENGFISFERWLQGTFAGYFIDELDYVIGQQFAELEDYLHSLFQWLAGQFDFTFGGTNYDDSSVIYWLRRIYARLGGGAPNPGDDGTVDEGFDWWAWLLGLITDALGGIITDLVGDIGGFLSAIAQKFPFSIPADIALYLSLLDAPRETPVFTFVIPAIQGWWDSWEIEIDLSPYDDALSIVRSMVLIWWGFVLVLRTDWLGGVFDDCARMVTGFFDKLTGGVANA